MYLNAFADTPLPVCVLCEVLLLCIVWICVFTYPCVLYRKGVLFVKYVTFRYVHTCTGCHYYGKSRDICGTI